MARAQEARPRPRGRARGAITTPLTRSPRRRPASVLHPRLGARARRLRPGWRRRAGRQLPPQVARPRKPVVVGVPLSACSQALRRSPRLHKRPQPQTEQMQTQPPTQTEQPQPPQRALRPLQLPPDRPAFSPPGRRPGSGLGGHGLRIVERWTDPWPYVVLCAVAIFCATYVAVSGTRCTNLNFQIWQPGAPRTYHLPPPHPSAPHRPRNCHNHLCALCADCSSMTRPHTLLSCLHFRVSCEARLSPSVNLA